MKKEMMENATGVKLTKKASKNVIRSLSVGLAAMMALSTPIATFAEDADGQNGSGTTPEESTTTVTTQKSAADQVKEIQDSDAANKVTDDTNAAKVAVNTAVDTAVDAATNTSDDTQTNIIDAANALKKAQNGENDNGEVTKTAEDAVKGTMKGIEDASNAAATTDVALKDANDKADEANKIADDANKEQKEAQDAFDKAKAGIDSATDIEDAKNAYDQAAGIVGDAQKAYETAKTKYDGMVAEYNTALDELKKAQEAYDTAVAAASTEAAVAAANLEAVQKKAQELQEAAEEAKTAIPELTKAQQAALEIIKLEKERAEDTSTNWRKEDELFKVILKNYYMPELIRGELVDCKWTWNQNDAKNYCEVTYTDVAGDLHTVYLNYKLNKNRDDLVIFEKAEEVVSYDVKSTDGSIAFNINAENFPADKLQNDQDTAVYENNGVVYTIVNIGGQFYVVDSASTDVEVNNNNEYNSEQYETSKKKTTYSVDENGKLVKTVKQNVSKITYTDTPLSSDKTYDSVEAAEKDLADKKAALKPGDKDVETSMSATATANVTVSQKTTFTTTIDLSKIVVEMEKINNDNDKYEKKNAEIAANELFAKFTNKEALENLLGGDYKIESITGNAKVNAVDKYKNTSGRLVDWFADSASYENVFSGTIVITYSQTVTAKKENVERSQTNAVNAADNTNLEALKGQAYDAAKADAEKLLGDAVSQNKKIKDNLKDGELHINGYVNKKGEMDSKVAIKIHYADDTFTEGKKTTDQAVVDEKNSSTTLSVSYTGTYQQKNSNDLGEQTVATQKYNQTAKAEEKTAYTSNKYYDEYKKTGEINDGIWLTGKDDNHFASDENFKNFRDFKDAAAKAEAERAEKVAKAEAIIKAAQEAAENAVTAVKAARNDAVSLRDQLTALLASQNYTADQVKELEEQIRAAEIKLKKAQEKADELNEALNELEGQRDSKITELTPAPAPGEGGSTTTPGGTTTPAGTVTTAAAPASTVTTVTTATAAAAPVQIAETPVALAATATPAAVTRTAAVANANAAADADADADTDVTIADEETPLAANGEQESTTIADEETPLAAEAGAVEDTQQEKMSWWWLLIIALLGVTGEEMYRRNKKKKAEAVQKDEK